jgi:uncharacterized membrane protein
MKLKKGWIAVIAPFALALFIWIGGEIVMHLWNWLLPPLFGWKLIGFWQALALLILCRVLFGGWGGGGKHGRRHRHFDERWERMTPEEREKMRQSWRGPHGGLGEQPAGSEPGV